MGYLTFFQPSTIWNALPAQGIVPTPPGATLSETIVNLTNKSRTDIGVTSGAETTINLTNKSETEIGIQ